MILSRSKADIELAAAQAALAEMTEQRNYWRTRAERLTDAALVRAGAVHQQTFEERKPLDRVAGAAQMLTAALAVTEIDSSQSRKVAS